MRTKWYSNIFLPTRNMTQKKMIGMSLIEILLVITVISILGVIGIQLLQTSAEQQKVEKTIEQFQLLILASRNYYEYQQAWPNLADLTSFAPNIVGTILENPWGNNFTLALDAAGFPPGISTVVPSERTAKLIVARLPFSHYQDCPSCLVQATVTIPSKIGWFEGDIKLPMIYNMGTLNIVSNDPEHDPGTQIPLPTQAECTAGYTPKWVAGFKSFVNTQPDDTRWFTSGYLCRKANNPSGTVTTCSALKAVPTGDNEVKVAFGWGNLVGTGITLGVWTTAAPKMTAEVVYLSYCDPKP